MPSAKRPLGSPSPDPQTLKPESNGRASQIRDDNPAEESANVTETDSNISVPNQVAYWSAITPTVDGMLGGFPQVSRIDIQFSRNFLRKLQRLDKTTRGGASTETPSNQHGYPFNHCLEPGAGIGRVTLNLLAGLCYKIDIIEPIKKFTDVLTAEDSPVVRSGQLQRVYNVPLQDWRPEMAPSYSAPGSDEETSSTTASQSSKYDLIYNQWCLNHLSMVDLVRYFTRLIPLLRPNGWIIVKENLSTDAFGNDIFDEEDSSVTRSDQNWRESFERAGLKLVKTEVQTGFPKELGLYPVRMYALRPK
ncbi:hypothetical protein HRR83_001309 [Exophiala dermatitidis]|uniref:Alpha N-terminal protein methyltransferase 1 n=2 Tax=Exophiala dermatitidis TaxID=5970 RepID=H6C6S1_EXODN|nr:uncharacterized protein HMPREF1120_07407 [Exophiala dermatitidis NIH/UT8656]KAJ4522811.1 hypothetical protein HRR75_001205 [Exophiala dermatitidis]EHY59417.1 hypothetical protein HMPREF1120_07407 [Exophiala dermatitidis NIH/UT8656]KAJ4526120.1 hypothetical protein HRR74_001313 [Exophiala dermatitidis]KAJ4526936.1 hypothetical protein HRR73_001733 [Exophiala dermatitidis]KAJ4532649.1 hypothetical protein HRR76_007634 [Exophiala dermatitidis]